MSARECTSDADCGGGNFCATRTGVCVTRDSNPGDTAAQTSAMYIVRDVGLVALDLLLLIALLVVGRSAYLARQRSLAVAR